jgi:hypothetical protein
MARLDRARLDVALLGRLRFAFGGGERLDSLGGRMSPRRVLGLFKTRRAERAALALDRRIFRL